MPIDKADLIDAISFEIKDALRQWGPQIERKLEDVLLAIIAYHNWDWAIRSISPDQIPLGSPPRILLPSDFYSLMDDGVVPVFYAGRDNATIGRVIHDSWSVSVSEWAYFSNSYVARSFPHEFWYNRVAVGPDGYLYFLNPSSHPYRISYKSIPPLSQWPREFRNVLVSEVSARMQIPLEGQDLLTTRAEFALAKANLQALALAESDKKSYGHRVASRLEKVRYHSGVVMRGPAPIIVAAPIPSIISISPSPAPAGSVVTIVGQNLLQITDFRINGIATTLTVVTPTEAKATVPNLAGGTYTTQYASAQDPTVPGPSLQVLPAPVVPTILSLSNPLWNAATATGYVVAETKLTGTLLKNVTEFRIIPGNYALPADDIGTDSPSVYFPNFPGTFDLIGITPSGNTAPFRINVVTHPVVPIPQPTIADILFDFEGGNGRDSLNPNVDYGYYPAGMPAEFDFKFGGSGTLDPQQKIVGKGPQKAVSSYNQITQHSFPRYEKRHARVETTPATTQYFSISQNKWILVEVFNFRGSAFGEDFLGNDATAADQFEYPDGTFTFRAGSNARGDAGKPAVPYRTVRFSEPGTDQVVYYNMHAFNFRASIDWTDVKAILVTQAMREVGTPPTPGEKPAYIANVGIDTWATVTSNFDDFATHGGVSGGRYKTVRRDWQNFTCYAGPKALLNTNPPIGYPGGNVVVIVPVIASYSSLNNRVGDTVTVTGTDLDLITAFRIGNTVVSLSGTGKTQKTFVLPSIPVGTYNTSYDTANSTNTSGPSLEVAATPGPPGAVPVISGFSGGNWDANASTASILTELTVQGTNLNNVTAFKANGILLTVDGLGSVSPRIFLPVTAGTYNITAEY